jgi:hypothetical protein
MSYDPTDSPGYFVQPHQHFTANLDISNANLRVAFGFLSPPTSKTLNAIRVCWPNTTGTLTNIGRAALHAADSNGRPSGAAIEEITFTPAAANTTTTITGFTTVLTANTRYCIVFRNAAASPGSNFFSAPWSWGTMVEEGWSFAYSDDAGSAYRHCQQDAPLLQLSFSDGSRWGPAHLRVVVGGLVGTGIEIYSNRICGVRYQPRAREVVRKVDTMLRLNGTFASAGAIICRIYNGTTLLYTSDNSEVSNSPSGQFGGVSFRFDNVTALIEPGMDITFAFCQAAAGGSSSHYYAVMGEALTIYAPTGFSDCSFGGMHSVRATDASSLSGWTIESACQYWFRALCRAAATRGGM